MPTGMATRSPTAVNIPRVGKISRRVLFGSTPSLKRTTMLLANPMRKAR